MEDHAHKAFRDSFLRLMAERKEMSSDELTNEFADDTMATSTDE